MMNSIETAVFETGFAIDDIILYLDTHPEDDEAMEYYECMKKKYKDAAKEYVNQYGPLVVADVPAGCRWMWTQTPWPWEGGCSCGTMKNGCSTR